MAPTRLQAQITHRKMRKDSWQPGVGHFPGTAVANSLSVDTQPHPVRFCGEKKMRGFIREPTEKYQVNQITGKICYNWSTLFSHLEEKPQ